MFLAPEQTANLFPTITLVQTYYPLNGWFVRRFQARNRGKTGKAAVTYFIMNGIEQPHAKRTNKKGKKTVP